MGADEGCLQAGRGKDESYSDERNDDLVHVAGLEWTDLSDAEGDDTTSFASSHGV